MRRGSETLRDPEEEGKSQQITAILNPGGPFINVMWHSNILLIGRGGASKPPTATKTATSIRHTAETER